MTADIETPAFILVTDETTRAELAVTLDILNTEAKRISRRGKVGLYSDAHRIQHDRINAILCDWERAPA